MYMNICMYVLYFCSTDHTQHEHKQAAVVLSCEIQQECLVPVQQYTANKILCRGSANLYRARTIIAQEAGN